MLVTSDQKSSLSRGRKGNVRKGMGHRGETN